MSSDRVSRAALPMRWGSSEMMKLLLAGLVVAGITPSHAETLRCDIASKYTCAASGCQPAKTAAFNIVDLDRKTIARCDSMGSRTYDALFRKAAFFSTSPFQTMA